MPVPDIIRNFGSAKVGAYRNVVSITYDLFPLDILVKLKHPMSDTIQSLKREMLTIRGKKESRELDDEEAESQGLVVRGHLRDILGSVFSDYSETGRGWQSKIVEEARSVLGIHMNILSNYGEVISHEMDCIYFKPKPEERSMLEGRNYFCTNRTYSSYVENKFQWIIFFGKMKHLSRNEQGKENAEGVTHQDKGVVQAYIKLMNPKCDETTLQIEPL
jgi:hypothetical protein